MVSRKTRWKRTTNCWNCLATCGDSLRYKLKCSWKCRRFDVFSSWFMLVVCNEHFHFVVWGSKWKPMLFQRLLCIATPTFQHSLLLFPWAAYQIPHWNPLIYVTYQRVPLFLIFVRVLVFRYISEMVRFWIWSGASCRCQILPESFPSIS